MKSVISDHSNLDDIQGKDAHQHPNVFSIPNTDAKLYLFSFLNNKKDVFSVCATNKENSKMFDDPKFWQQRSQLDNHRYIADNAYAKGIYLNNYQPWHIQKIVYTTYFTVGIDYNGKLHFLEESLDRNNKEALRQLHLLSEFTKNKKILDMYTSEGGSNYIRTTDGLYGWGSNFNGQLGKEDQHPLDEIRLIQASTANNRILQSDCGMAYSLTRTKDEVILRGKVSQKNHNEVHFKAHNVVDIKCGYQKAYALKRDGTLIEVGENGPTPIHAFDGKKIKEVQTLGRQTVVLCNDGLYLDDGFGFAKLDFFNDKTIYHLDLSHNHMIVHCKEGIYAKGMNRTGQLGVGDLVDRQEFTRLDLDPNKVTNLHVTNNTFIEMDGKWLMAGGFKKAGEVDKYRMNFEEVHFEAVSVNAAPRLR